MAATKTAEGLARNLTDNLNQRLGAGVAATAYDSNSDIYVTVTTAAGNNGVKAMIRIKPIALPTAAVDALGNAQRVVGPHVAQVMFDDSTHGTTTTDAQKLTVWGEVLRLGTLVEGYSKNVGAAIMAVADFATATAAGTFQQIPGRDVGSI